MTLIHGGFGYLPHVPAWVAKRRCEGRAFGDDERNGVLEPVNPTDPKLHERSGVSRGSGNHVDFDLIERVRTRPRRRFASAKSGEWNSKHPTLRHHFPRAAWTAEQT